MELFGIGPMELLLILIVALIIFGPKDIEKVGRTIGRSLYRLTHSDLWRMLTMTSRSLLDLPNDLMKQAEQEELKKQVEEGAIKKEDWLQDPHIAPPRREPETESGTPPIPGPEAPLPGDSKPDGSPDPSSGSQEPKKLPPV